MEAHLHHSCQGSNSLGYRPSQLPRYISHPWRTPFHTKPFSHSLISFSSNNFPRWNNSADETFPPPNFNFNNATRTKPQNDDEEEDEDDDGEYEKKKRRWWFDESLEEPEEEVYGGGGWKEDLDSLWILKVFKSYGWTLPIVLASWLLSSGPKAFLMAFGIILGQSAVALAFEKLWGLIDSKPKRKYRMKRKRRNVNDTRIEEEPEENEKTNNTRKAGMQSWVVENDGSVDSGGSRNAPSFGGWDDLERPRPKTRRSQARKGSQRGPMEGGRLSRRERKSDTPLLVRLLIAIFPFLGTWTKML